MIPEGDWVMPQAPVFFIRICINKRLNTDRLPSCAARGSRELALRLEERLTAENLPVEVRRGPCMNNCAIGPNLKIQAGALFNLNDDTSAERLEEILAAIRDEIAKRKAAAPAT